MTNHQFDRFEQLIRENEQLVRQNEEFEYEIEVLLTLIWMLLSEAR